MNVAGGPQASNPLKRDLREARKRQTIKKAICGRPASIKSFKKRVAGGPQASKPLKSDLRGGHIGAQETIETAIGIPLWIFLHQKDKLENKIKQDHFK